MLSKTLIASLFIASALAAPSAISKRDIPTTELAANAQKTGDDGHGKDQIHQLGPGTFGQVITPGADDAGSCGRDFDGQTPFGLSYVGWLCEVPTDAQLGGNCPKWLGLAGIDASGQTGHHDILTDPQYKTIGCAFARNPDATCDGGNKYTGLWVCDLGF